MEHILFGLEIQLGNILVALFVFLVLGIVYRSLWKKLQKQRLEILAHVDGEQEALLKEMRALEELIRIQRSMNDKAPQ